jgi:3-methyladenine DNA glycosylase/8-oxoguanine DNA glycosylase
VLGADDDPSGFEPRHPVLVDLHRRHPHWRLGRSDRVFEALVPSIVEQKVTGKEAFAGFRSLVHFHGERARARAASRSCGCSRRPRCCA